jgi:hypothetical protein
MGDYFKTVEEPLCHLWKENRCVICGKTEKKVGILEKAQVKISR